MSSKGLWYAMTRGKVYFPALVGSALIVLSGAKLAGFIVLGVGVFHALRVLTYSDLEERLTVRHHKQKASVRRNLYAGEVREMQALESYFERLQKTGAQKKLVEQARSEAWSIINASPHADATNKLRRFRESLPPLEREQNDKAASVAEAIREELDILRSTRKEVSATMGHAA